MTEVRFKLEFGSEFKSQGDAASDGLPLLEDMESVMGYDFVPVREIVRRRVMMVGIVVRVAVMVQLVVILRVAVKQMFALDFIVTRERSSTQANYTIMESDNSSAGGYKKQSRREQLAARDVDTVLAVSHMAWTR